jgi:hypothetical protein
MLWCKKVETSCALASKNKDCYLLRRDTVGMGVCAVENSMPFILDIIISLAQITGRGGPAWGSMFIPFHTKS